MYQRKLSVLLIDDDPDDYLIVRDLLQEAERSPIAVDWASSYEAGLAAIAERRYNAYLVDFHLGAHTGLELIGAAIAAGHMEPFILLTGRHHGDSDIAAIQAGASDFLDKSQLTTPLLERSIRYAVERARITADLHASNERYRMVAETATDAIVTVSADGTLSFVNRAAEQIFGYRPDELIGQPLTLLMPEELRERHSLHVGAFLAQESPEAHRKPLEQLGRHKRGHTIPLEVSVGVARVGAEMVLVGMIRDVSERRRLEEELRHAQKMEAVGRLAGGVAHDFNNVLTAITGYSDLLLSELGPSQQAQRDDIEQIMQAARRAARLTQQLLAFSRKQVLQPEVIDLNAAVAEMAPMLRRLIGEDVLLATDLAPDLGLIEVDPGQIQQVIMNLAVNARDAMPRGGSLHIATAPADDRVALIVSDTGHGMDAETRRRAFEPFYTTKERGKGTGLGLATVYGIITQSGGEIDLDSAPGRGTTFTIRLPRATAGARTPGPAPAIDRAQGSETVLLVEDDPPVRNLIEAILRAFGYTVVSATTGAEALELARRSTRPMHLLISDVIMPGMNGVDLAAILTAAYPELRVLFISGYPDDAIDSHGVLAPGIAFLQKPFHPEELARKVRAILDAPHARATGDR